MSWIRDPKQKIKDEESARKAEEQYLQSLIQEWDAPVKALLNDAGKFIWGRRFPYLYYVKSETKYTGTRSKRIHEQLWRVGKGRKYKFDPGYDEGTSHSPNITVELRFNRRFDPNTGLPDPKHKPYFVVSGYWGTSRGGDTNLNSLSKDELQEALQKAIEFMVRKEESGAGW